MQKNIGDYIEYKDKIKSIKERVLFLYNSSQRCIESDVELIKFYEHFFEPAKYTEDSIKRAGRFFRATMPQKYIRSASKVKEDKLKEQANKVVWK